MTLAPGAPMPMPIPANRGGARGEGPSAIRSRGKGKGRGPYTTGRYVGYAKAWRDYKEGLEQEYRHQADLELSREREAEQVRLTGDPADDAGEHSPPIGRRNDDGEQDHREPLQERNCSPE